MQRHLTSNKTLSARISRLAIPFPKSKLNILLFGNGICCLLASAYALAVYTIYKNPFCKCYKYICLAISLGSLSACANKAFEVLNPYAEASDVELGQRNNQTIIEETGMEGESQNARHALEVMGSYRRAQAPQPAYPVVQPAEVRLMWVPDHLNKAGDLVPAHYYYLRVLNDRWAVQDAFDMEEQLRQGSTGGSSSVPWVYK